MGGPASPSGGERGDDTLGLVGVLALPAAGANCLHMSLLTRLRHLALSHPGPFIHCNLVVFVLNVLVKKLLLDISIIFNGNIFISSAPTAIILLIFLPQFTFSTREGLVFPPNFAL